MRKSTKMPKSRSAVDKAGRRSRNSANQNQVPEVEEIIPGRLTQPQWMDMLLQEDTEEAVGEIREQLISQVMEGCLMVDIKRQLATFSISWAKSHLIQMLEQHVLCRDKGEEPEEAARTEDSEPVPTTADTWAQGCLPVIQAISPPTPTLQQEEDDICPALEPTQPSTSQQLDAVAPPMTSEHPEKEKSPHKPVSDKISKGFRPLAPIHISPKKKQDHSPPKLVPSKFLPPLPHPAEKMDTLGEDRATSVPQPRAGSLHPYKRYQAIHKLDHARLPRHWIIPQYEIVSDHKPELKKPSGLSKLTEPRFNQVTETTWKPLTECTDRPAKVQKRKDADTWQRRLSPSRYRREELMSSGPVKQDSGDLVKGISLLDHQAVEMNVKFKPQPQFTKLRPIRIDATAPVFSVDQITTGPPPQVTTLSQS